MLYLQSRFNQVHLSSRSNWRENSRGKSRGTKDTDPRAIRALSSRIVGLEFRDNWNGDDNATRSRRKIRAGMGVGTANTDYSPPLLYHPSAQKKITIFPLHPTFFLLPLFDISKAWESKRRDGFAAADWIRTQLEFRKRRERGGRGSIKSLGCGTKRYCILDLIEPGNLFVHRDFLRFVWFISEIAQYSILSNLSSFHRIPFPDDSLKKVWLSGEGKGDKACN